MKKPTAILLLALLFFNVAGYQLFFELLQEQHKLTLEALLDKHAYNDNDLLELKVPLSMPYLSVETSFERVDGEVNIDGRIYKYVKRKVQDGALILLCIPDYRKTGIEQAKTQFGASANELPLAGKKAPISFKKINVASEYEEIATQLLDAAPVIPLETKVDFFTPILPLGFAMFAERPPQAGLS